EQDRHRAAVGRLGLARPVGRRRTGRSSAEAFGGGLSASGSSAARTAALSLTRWASSLSKTLSSRANWVRAWSRVSVVLTRRRQARRVSRCRLVLLTLPTMITSMVPVYHRMDGVQGAESDPFEAVLALFSVTVAIPARVVAPASRRPAHPWMRPRRGPILLRRPPAPGREIGPRSAR